MNKNSNHKYKYLIGVVVTILIAAYSHFFQEDKPVTVIKEKPKNEVREEPIEPKITESKGTFKDSAIDSNVSEMKGRVKFIPDGDTIHLTDGTKVRLVGINCPENYHDQKLTQKCAIEAYDYLKSLISNKELTIKFNVNNKLDQFQRVLGDVYVGELWVNYEMIKNGFAFVYTTSDSEVSKKLYEAEEYAQANKIGLWEGNNPPELFEKYEPSYESGDLAQYVNKTVLITGVVDKFQKNGGATILSIKLKDGNIIKASISKKNYSHFPITLKSEVFLHKKISIMGRVNIYNDKTELVIRYPTQILLK